MPERRAAVTWEGNLLQGHGTITDTGSGALTDLPVSWAARTESSDGKTSPEELLAAAQAACFAMAFSGALARAHHTAESLSVNAVCTFDRIPEGGWKVGSMTITVAGRVPGIAAADFTRIAEETSQGCPISGAIKGNVEISVNATLES
jgi:osmotically inducible protein OsmC